MITTAMVRFHRALLLALLAACVSSQAQEANNSGAGIVNPLLAHDTAPLQGFLGRPLFSPSRRAPPPVPEELPVAAAPAEDTQARPEIRLVGIIRTPRENIAQLAEGDAARRHSVRLGDFLGGWAVVAISESSLTLQKGGAGNKT